MEFEERVYVTVLPLKFALPFEGLDASAYVKLSPSGSLPAKVIDLAASSLVDTDCALADGASLTALTVIDTVAAEEVAVPSETVNVKLSDPL